MAGELRRTERRRDYNDGAAYTFEEFIEHYGDDSVWRGCEEVRVDPADGFYYTKRQFMQEYGGTVEWARAAPEAQAAAAGTAPAAGAAPAAGTAAAEAMDLDDDGVPSQGAAPDAETTAAAYADLAQDNLDRVVFGVHALRQAVSRRIRYDDFRKTLSKAASDGQLRDDTRWNNRCTRFTHVFPNKRVVNVILSHPPGAEGEADLAGHTLHVVTGLADGPDPDAVPQARPAGKWTCSNCGFGNNPRNEVCGGEGGTLGCKRPRVEAAAPTAWPVHGPPAQDWGILREYLQKAVQCSQFRRAWTAEVTARGDPGGTKGLYDALSRVWAGPREPGKVYRMPADEWVRREFPHFLEHARRTLRRDPKTTLSGLLALAVSAKPGDSAKLVYDACDLFDAEYEKLCGRPRRYLVNKKLWAVGQFRGARGAIEVVQKDLVQRGEPCDDEAVSLCVALARGAREAAEALRILRRPAAEGGCGATCGKQTLRAALGVAAKGEQPAPEDARYLEEMYYGLTRDAGPTLRDSCVWVRLLLRLGREGEALDLLGREMDGWLAAPMRSEEDRHALAAVGAAYLSKGRLPRERAEAVYEGCLRQRATSWALHRSWLDYFDPTRDRAARRRLIARQNVLLKRDGLRLRAARVERIHSYRTRWTPAVETQLEEMAATRRATGMKRARERMEQGNDGASAEDGSALGEPAAKRRRWAAWRAENPRPRLYPKLRPEVLIDFLRNIPLRQVCRTGRDKCEFGDECFFVHDPEESPPSQEDAAQVAERAAQETSFDRHAAMRVLREIRGTYTGRPSLRRIQQELHQPLPHKREREDGEEELADPAKRRRRSRHSSQHCAHYMRGYCMKGERCNFRHDPHAASADKRARELGLPPEAVGLNPSVLGPREGPWRSHTAFGVKVKLPSPLATSRIWEAFEKIEGVEVATVENFSEDPDEPHAFVSFHDRETLSRVLIQTEICIGGVPVDVQERGPGSTGKNWWCYGPATLGYDPEEREWERCRGAAPADDTPGPALPPNARTKLCITWAGGKACAKSDCYFAHGLRELHPEVRNKYKTRACEHFARGACSRSLACVWAHGDADVVAPGSYDDPDSAKEVRPWLRGLSPAAERLNALKRQSERANTLWKEFCSVDGRDEGRPVYDPRAHNDESLQRAAEYIRERLPGGGAAAGGAADAAGHRRGELGGGQGRARRRRREGSSSPEGKGAASRARASRREPSGRFEETREASPQWRLTREQFDEQFGAEGAVRWAAAKGSKTEEVRIGRDGRLHTAAQFAREGDDWPAAPPAAPAVLAEVRQLYGVPSAWDSFQAQLGPEAGAAWADARWSAAHEEVRCDPADGGWYTQQEFLAQYGSHDRWLDAVSGPQ